MSVALDEADAYDIETPAGGSLSGSGYWLLSPTHSKGIDGGPDEPEEPFHVKSCAFRKCTRSRKNTLSPAYCPAQTSGVRHPPASAELEGATGEARS
uniref:Uncharacterized protein n=1 Tax=Hyaloperonospora arabidopsidis (strain Emoy2) TaxID=559515 RepID=M4BLI3_HYAAE